MTKGIFKNKTILVVFVLIVLIFPSLFSQANKTQLTNKTQLNICSRKYYIWAMSDTHRATYFDNDVSFNENTWSGNLISEGVERIDYAFIAEDITLIGDNAEDYSTYINQTCSCILPNRDMNLFWNQPADERIWGFCMGNHDAYIYGLNDAVAGLGIDSSKSWYNNKVTMENCYNYVALRGNLLFIYMGGDRSNPDDYSYNILTSQDFNWLEHKISWADNNNINVVIVTHCSIFNSSNSYNFPGGYSNHDVYYDVESNKWKTCDEHTRYVCDFDDPWPGSNHLEECDDYWYLIKNYKNVNLWFSGHIHTANDNRGSPPHEHMGWDTTLGVERNIQKSPYCTFVNLGAIFAWGMPWSYSRVLVLSENSKDVLFKSFDHMSHSYGHDQSWDSSHQDITITNCLKYPFDLDFVVT